MTSEPPTPKPASQKSSMITELMRALTIVAVLVLGMWALFISANQPDQLLPEKCVFPAGIYCEDYTVESDGIHLVLTNSMGRDIILTKVISTDMSSPPLHRCEMSSGEITIPSGEHETVIADNCTIHEIMPEYRFRYDINLTFRYVNSGEEHTMPGELYVGGRSRETSSLKSPRETISTILLILAYLVVLRLLWGQIIKNAPKRERLICLGIGIICSPVVIALIVVGIMLVGFLALSNLFRLGALIGLVAIVILFSQAWRLINRQGTSDFIKGVLAYALIIGLLHFFALVIWYFFILSPTY